MNNNGERNSSIELFRLLAIFLVVLVHMNGYFLILGHNIHDDANGGGYIQFTNHYISQYAWLHEFVQALSCVCVNCFILISGYFSMKLKAKSIWNLYYTIVGVTLPLAFILYFSGLAQISIGDVMANILAFSHHGYFIQCYLVLLCISPILNKYIDNASTMSVLLLTILLVMIEGYLTLSNIDETGFHNGYRLPHFIIMYLVGRCVYLFKNNLHKVSNTLWVSIYILGAFLMSVLFLHGVYQIYNYSTPLNIVMSVALFIPFTKWHFYKKWINWASASSFTVYLINTPAVTRSVYVKVDNFAFEHFQLPYFYGLVLVIILLGFIFSIIYDKLFRFITRPFNAYILKQCSKIDKLNIHE